MAAHIKPKNLVLVGGASDGQKCRFQNNEGTFEENSVSRLSYKNE